MKEESKGTVELIGRDRIPVKVCDVINGKPKVKQVIKDDCIEFVLRYSLFRKEIKRYDKKHLKELSKLRFAKRNSLFVEKHSHGNCVYLSSEGYKMAQIKIMKFIAAL